MKTETQPQISVIPWVMVTPKQGTVKCSWGLYCPICKNEEEHEEDWDETERATKNVPPKHTTAPATKCSAIPITEHSAPPII